MMKSGTVAVIGAANAGKSTLINVIVGEKVSIVSPKPQTTRERILGVLTTDDYQIVFEDTPGMYKASTLLNSRMQRSVVTTAKDVDVILFCIDGHESLKEEDLSRLSKFANSEIPVVVALTKTDIMQKEKIPSELVEISKIEGVSDIIPVSSRKGRNVKELINILLSYLPEREKIFTEDIISDKSERFMIAEIMREKILLKYDKEIPHGINVKVNKFELQENGVYEINLDIICEKENHKAIIIGRGGKKLKEVNTFAREGMEKFLGAKVFLTTYVVVKSDWRNDVKLLDEFGFGERKI